VKLFIKQKVFTLVPEFTVKDEFGNDRWFVKGKFLSFEREHIIYNMHGQPVARIHRELFRILSRYHLEVNGQKIAEIVREFSFFKPRYHIEGSNLRVEGDWLAHEYTIFEHDRPIMQISKQWFSWGDSYMLDIPNPQHELLALGLVLAIDICLSQQHGA